MAWCLFGTKPLPEPMMTQFIEAHMHHQTSITNITEHQILVIMLFIFKIEIGPYIALFESSINIST